MVNKSDELVRKLLASRKNLYDLPKPSDKKIEKPKAKTAVAKTKKTKSA